ncbi:MAG: T9SS type B sorting domain-containing protein [Bacteroidetes bacterium]|nr:T9SS type B sorting domain-containing protein [Bacteroidota bacterium]
MSKLLKISPFVLAITFCQLLNAQPEPCDPAIMTPTCEEACIICDIDGFTGINDSPVQGVAPPGFCTFGVQNITWIAFLAGSTNLTLEVAVSNCQNNIGLQIGIYEGINCQNYELVSNCENSIPPGTTATFINNQPLVVGQYYYFVMDGDLGDICNYTVSVVEGSTLVPPLPSSGEIEGPSLVCTNQNVTYTTPGVPGATIYEWTLDNTLLSTDTEVDIDWNQQGSFELCLSAANVCDQPDPTCITVIVDDIEPTVYEETLCEGDCFEVADTILCDPGNYSFSFGTSAGCDSLVIVEITGLSDSELDLELNICEGDTLNIAGTPYFETGVFQEILPNAVGCDSIITLDLTTVVCEIIGEVEATPAACFGTSTASFSFFVTDGTPPFTYSWERLDGFPSGNGDISNLNEEIFITDLPVGTYLVTINDNFGNDVILITEVTQPEYLDAESTFSNYNGYPISCEGGSDGWIAVQPGGGVAPYTYLWSDDSTDSLLMDVGAGLYTVTITDFNGCQEVYTYQFIDPPPLVLAASFYDPDCDGFDTGSILVDTAYGGVGQLLFDIGQGGPKDVEEFENLFGGEYTLTLTDANGCTVDTTAILNPPQIPLITHNSPIDINLGETADLEIFVNLIPDSIAWEGLDLTCYDCLNPSVVPIEDTFYPVTVWSEQDCEDSDTLLVRVNVIRNVYIPNIFSPNNDGINDIFYPFAGPEVLEIKQLQIFDRWGDHVFSAQNFQPNDPTQGWDGTHRNKKCSAGIFAYYAEVVFVDGITAVYKGDITLIR